jgi:hypothetical protein
MYITKSITKNFILKKIIAACIKNQTEKYMLCRTNRCRNCLFWSPSSTTCFIRLFVCIKEQSSSRMKNRSISRMVSSEIRTCLSLVPISPFSRFISSVFSFSVISHMNNEGQKFECNKIFYEKRNILRAE